MEFDFFNDTTTTEIYTLSLHDALPICNRTRAVPRPGVDGHALRGPGAEQGDMARRAACARARQDQPADRKSTRLNSSHANISYAVFCLKKKKNKEYVQEQVSLASCVSR